MMVVAALFATARTAKRSVFAVSVLVYVSAYVLADTESIDSSTPFHECSAALRLSLHQNIYVGSGVL